MEYEASFVEGKLKRIEQVDYKIKPALPSSKHLIFDQSKSLPLFDKNEPLVGKRFYFYEKFLNEEYWGEAVYEIGNEVCIKFDKKIHGSMLRICQKNHRNRLFWDSKEIFKEQDKARQDFWDKQKKEYDDYCKEWEEKRKAKS